MTRASMENKVIGKNGNPRLIVMDLEYTAWEGSLERNWSGPGEVREIIQLGAVDVTRTVKTWVVGRRLDVHVRPKINPNLSLFIQKLTGISLKKIQDEGVSFPKALEKLIAFIPNQARILVNGDDAVVINENCVINQILNPFPSGAITNIRPLLADILGVTIESSALHSFRLGRKTEIQRSERRPHNAIDDALCIAEELIDKGICDQVDAYVKRLNSSHLNGGD